MTSILPFYTDDSIFMLKTCLNYERSRNLQARVTKSNVLIETLLRAQSSNTFLRSVSNIS